MSPTRKEFAEALLMASETFRQLAYLSLTSQDVDEWMPALGLAKITMRDLVGKMKRVTDITQLPVDPQDKEISKQ